MSQAKIFWVAWLAVAVSLCAFAASASATVLTSEGATYTGAIEMSGEVYFEGVANGCEFSSKTEVKSHGKPLAELGVSHITFENCDEGTTVTLSSPGSVYVQTFGIQGLLISVGTTVTITGDLSGKSCRYATDGKNALGLIWSSKYTGATAEGYFNGRFVLEEGDFGCWEETYLRGNFIITTPDNLNFD